MKIDQDFIVDCLKDLRAEGDFRPTWDGRVIRLFHSENEDLPLCPLAALFYWWSSDEGTPCVISRCGRAAFVAEAANFRIPAKLANAVMDAADFKGKEPKLRRRIIEALGL